MTDEIDATLFAYQIASADMKYIEINTREIILRMGPEGCLVLRGEIPGCGDSCFANLSEVFLEYAMSCKGCMDSSVMFDSIADFGERLGNRLARVFLKQYPGQPITEKVPEIFACVMASMGHPFEKEDSKESLIFHFKEAPLDATADDAGLQLWTLPAFQGWVALLESVIQTAGGGWTLQSPTRVSEDPSTPVVHLKRAV